MGRVIFPRHAIIYKRSPPTAKAISVDPMLIITGALAILFGALILAEDRD